MWSLSVTDDRLSQAEAMARESPEFVVAAAVVAIVAIVGAYVLFRSRTPGVKFHRLLAERDEIAVLMHPNPRIRTRCRRRSASPRSRSSSTSTRRYSTPRTNPSSGEPGVPHGA